MYNNKYVPTYGGQYELFIYTTNNILLYIIISRVLIYTYTYILYSHMIIY